MGHEEGHGVSGHVCLCTHGRDVSVKFVIQCIFNSLTRLRIFECTLFDATEETKRSGTYLEEQVLARRLSCSAVAFSWIR